MSHAVSPICQKLIIFQSEATAAALESELASTRARLLGLQQDADASADAAQQLRARLAEQSQWLEVGESQRDVAERAAASADAARAAAVAEVAQLREAQNARGDAKDAEVAAAAAQGRSEALTEEVAALHERLAVAEASFLGGVWIVFFWIFGIKSPTCGKSGGCTISEETENMMFFFLLLF